MKAWLMTVYRNGAICNALSQHEHPTEWIARACQTKPTVLLFAMEITSAQREQMLNAGWSCDANTMPFKNSED